jgi:heat-inducible transcriptional repressor
MTALMSAAMAASDEAISRKSEDYVISGERNLLNINDLAANMTQLRNLFNVFEQKTELLHLLDVGRHAPGVHIFVGNES